MKEMTKGQRQLRIGAIANFVDGTNTRKPNDEFILKSMGKLILEQLHNNKVLRDEIAELRKEVEELKAK